MFNKRLIIFCLFIATVTTTNYSPDGKCHYERAEGIYPYTGAYPNSYQLGFHTSKCDQTQKAFQFFSWVRLDADVPDGEAHYFFRYHTLIKIEFRGYPNGQHRLIISKSNENPTKMRQVPVGKSGKWMFVWLQVTQNSFSLAVRSTMNFELEENKVYRKVFSKPKKMVFIIYSIVLKCSGKADL